VFSTGLGSAPSEREARQKTISKVTDFFWRAYVGSPKVAGWADDDIGAGHTF